MVRVLACHIYGKYWFFKWRLGDGVFTHWDYIRYHVLLSSNTNYFIGFMRLNNGENGQGSRYYGSKQVGESTFSICLKCRWRKLPPPIISKDIIIHLRIIMHFHISINYYAVTLRILGHIFIYFETCGSNLIIPLKRGINYGDPALLFHSLQFLNGPSSAFRIQIVIVKIINSKRGVEKSVS